MKMIYKKDDPMRNLFLKAHQSKDAHTVSDGKGYRLTSCKEHPAASCRGYVPSHRLVAEVNLGRFLYPWEIVHHKKQKSNNHKNTIEVLAGRSEHNKIHQKYNDPTVVRQVLKAAQDPTVRKIDLIGIHKRTIDLICKNHHVVWKSAALKELDADYVKKLKKTHSTEEIAGILGVHSSTLLRRFPEIFRSQRRKSGWLNMYRIEVEDSMKRVGLVKTAKAFDTTRKTIKEYITKWQNNEVVGSLPLYEQEREKVFALLREKVSMEAIATQYGVATQTIKSAIYRWSNNGELPNDIVSQLNADPHRKLKLHYKASV